MIFRPKGRDDCCCKSWKDKINELWEKYQGVVKGVKAGSVTAYPDGDGIADLDGAVADAIAQQVPPMLTDLVTETELSTALEDYPTETDLAQTLEDYATQQDLETKQDVLVSGETIRTINGRDLLGEGNLKFLEIADLKTINGESLMGPGDVSVLKISDLKTVNGESLEGPGNIDISLPILNGGTLRVTHHANLNGYNLMLYRIRNGSVSYITGHTISSATATTYNYSIPRAYFQEGDLVDIWLGYGSGAPVSGLFSNLPRTVSDVGLSAINVNQIADEPPSP